MLSASHAGAVVFRVDGELVRVLLVRSKKDPALWVIPKGQIEPGETPQVAALREAFEEAGVTGLVLDRAGPTLRFRSGDEDVAVEYFLVELTAEMPSPEGREKCWCLPEEANARLVFQNARDVLRTAMARVPIAGADREGQAPRTV